MKVVILSHSFSPNIGGIESVSEQLAFSFTALGHDVSVITKTEQESIIDYPFKVIRNPSIFRVFKLMKSADIILENNPCLGLSWPNTILNKPLVIALHTWISRPDGRVSLIDRIKKLYLSRAGKVISVSKALQSMIYKNSVVIGNAYNSLLFKRDELYDKTKDFVFLGRLVSDKGCEIAIQAFNEFLKFKNESSLTIIGDGEERESLVALVKKLGIIDKVNFLGSKTGVELVSILNEYKYLLVPSVWEEPFGIVALEGMACGCIPIVSNGGGLPDAVGNAGVIFERGNYNDLLNKMIQISEDSNMYLRLRENAILHLEKHTPEMVTRCYVEVLESVLE